MWQLNFDRLNGISPFAFGSIAIESGTCRGNGTRALAKKFPKVFTIELSEQLSALAKEKLAGEQYSHITFLRGNSAEELRKLLPTLPSEESIFFFLDAHWSGDDSVAWGNSAWKGYGINTAHLGETGKRPSGKEQCPLEEELAAIMKYYPGPANILVDDLQNIPAEGAGLRDFHFEGEDWSHLTRQRLLAVVNPRLVRAELLENPSQWYLSLGAI